MLLWQTRFGQLGHKCKECDAWWQIMLVCKKLTYHITWKTRNTILSLSGHMLIWGGRCMEKTTRMAVWGRKINQVCNDLYNIIHFPRIIFIMMKGQSNRWVTMYHGNSVVWQRHVFLFKKQVYLSKPSGCTVFNLNECTACKTSIATGRLS